MAKKIGKLVNISEVSSKNKLGPKPERLNLTLTPEQSVRFNTYIVNLGKKLGRIPSAIKTKILRMALDEWFERHETDYDIDWEKKPE